MKKYNLMIFIKKALLITYNLLLITVLFSGCSTLNPSAEKENIQDIVNKVNNSKLILLDVYHDRCETCKFIEPTFKKLESDYAQNPDIVFLKYDLSNPFTILRSKKIAKAVGLEQIYKSQRYSGIVLFIDSKTKQVPDTLIGESNIEIYNKIIKEKLK